MCNDLFKLFENPDMAEGPERIGLWIGMSAKALKDLRTLGLPCRMVPYAVDPAVYTVIANGDLKERLRAELGIPPDAYVIGNMMRDTLGADLSRPKPQKAPEMLAEIASAVHASGRRIHVLLAGPRRHWLRRELARRGVPFAFAGKNIDGDDYSANILSQERVAALYHAMDATVVCSRWEGGPRAVLEAAACGTKVISTRVGMAPDLLEPECLFSSIDEGVNTVTRDMDKSTLARTVEGHRERVLATHTPRAIAAIWRQVYDDIESVSVFRGSSGARTPPASGAVRAPLKRPGRGWFSRFVRRSRQEPVISLWHEFHKPPYGGGNQFMLALRGALERRGVAVRVNSMSADVHICNSAWFDIAAFDSAISRGGARMIHRVDGPIALYRGTDWAEDEKIWNLNRRFAGATVFQSAWCMTRLAEHGLTFRRPMIIGNAVDPVLFHSPASHSETSGRRLRLISSAWSDNPRKGGSLYRYLDEALDWSRYEYTFVGRVQQEFKNIRHVQALPSSDLADLMRQHDIYITASQADPCSNALLEALACGLPALYLDDGGHGSLVGFGGLPFQGQPDVLGQLDRLAAHYAQFRALIHVDGIDAIAGRYLAVARNLAAESNPQPG